MDAVTPTIDIAGGTSSPAWLAKRCRPGNTFTISPHRCQKDIAATRREATGRWSIHLPPDTWLDAHDAADEYGRIQRASIAFEDGVPLLRAPAREHVFHAVVHVIFGESSPDQRYWTGVVGNGFFRRGSNSALVNIRDGERVFIFYPDGAVAQVSSHDLLGGDDLRVVARKLCPRKAVELRIEQISASLKRKTARDRAVREIPRLLRLASWMPEMVERIMWLSIKLAESGELDALRAERIMNTYDNWVPVYKLCTAPLVRRKHPPFATHHERRRHARSM